MVVSLPEYHPVAVLDAVVRDGETAEPQWAGFRRRFDNEGHVWRVFDVEIEGGPVASGPLQDAKDGLHYATFASSASATVSVRDGSNAARMTAEVC